MANHWSTHRLSNNGIPGVIMEGKAKGTKPKGFTLAAAADLIAV
jgi:hypothetical protein